MFAKPTPSKHNKAPSSQVESSEDLDPDPTEHLKAYAKRRLAMRPRDSNDRLLNLYVVGLDAVRHDADMPGLKFMLKEGGKDMLLWGVDIGDAPRGHGIGSLLMVKAVQHSISNVSLGLETVSRQKGNAGLVGMMQNVFGTDNVTYRVPDHRSAGQDLVCDVQARIDRQRIMSINLTEHLGELASKGYVDLATE